MSPDYYPWLARLLFQVEAERAHRLTIRALRTGLVPTPAQVADRCLAGEIGSLRFANPVGLAAGFDKNAEAVDALLALGFGFVEVGTVTPRPQRGNPRPRLFRLEADQAVVNRMGFNNDGADVVGRRLALRRERGRKGVVGANVGPNRDAEDPAADCATAFAALAPFVDYVVINVSSPNTPGLRDLQRREALERLVDRVLAARARSPVATPLFVKISPDTTHEERAAIAEVALASGLDGLIATNTTIARPSGLRSPHRDQTGGLSGKPLFAAATAVLADLARLTGGRLPLIGVGGIGSGDDAYAKIGSGASAVQLYTALVYRGPRLITAIKHRLIERLRGDGFSSLSQAVGRDLAETPRAGTAP
ncbi:MAG: quinone-dependent dihydroorotate dehydrogenase [Rhodospirillales bacterium]